MLAEVGRAEDPVLRELHRLLVRSVFKHPRLETLKTRAENSIAIRKGAVRKADSNILGAPYSCHMREVVPECRVRESEGE